MALLSSKSSYGLIAVCELVKHYDNDKPIKIKQIAEDASLPRNYLEQLLNRLKKDNIIKSVRGAHGGYKLASHPSDIKVLDVIRSLEGSINITDTHTDSPVMELFYSHAQEKLDNIFTMSLEDLKFYQQEAFGQLSYTI